MDNNIALVTLTLLVEQMRDTQKEYFKKRDKESLIKSKNLETQVDKLIIKIKGEHKNG